MFIETLYMSHPPPPHIQHEYHLNNSSKKEGCHETFTTESCLMACMDDEVPF